MRRIGGLRRIPPGNRPRGWTQWLGQNWARVTYGRHIEPTWLELTSHDVIIPDLPLAFDGFRIAHLTDFHAGRRVPSSYLWEAVELANAQGANLVALTGDFIHAGFKHVERVASIVGRLTAPDGVFAVLGNHDYSVRNALGFRRHRDLPDTIASALERHCIRVLRNQAVTLCRAGGSLHLVGVDDLWSRSCDVHAAFSDVAAESPIVLLAHNPHTVTHLAGRRCDLALSGHTHGGQVNWPGLGRFFLSRNGRRFAAGMYEHAETRLYVNRGVGFGVRFRFNVRPEVAVFRLCRA
jgi:predicted MPP superfamily phosphohydrolase